jgi:hypothetical protein
MISYVLRFAEACAITKHCDQPISSQRPSHTRLPEHDNRRNFGSNYLMAVARRSRVTLSADPLWEGNYFAFGSTFLSVGGRPLSIVIRHNLPRCTGPKQ